jgi:uncharacterized protein YsxB (DUF464 family)
LKVKPAVCSGISVILIACDLRLPEAKPRKPKRQASVLLTVQVNVACEENNDAIRAQVFWLAM